MSDHHLYQARSLSTTFPSRKSCLTPFLDWRLGSVDYWAVSSYQAWFQCINGCEQRFSLFDVIYRCPKCGDLLDVVHDVAALKDRSAAAWINLFEERMRRNTWPYM